MAPKIEIKHSVVIINNSDTAMRSETSEKLSCVVGLRLTPENKETHETMTAEEFLEWKRMNDDFFESIRFKNKINAQKHAEAEILAKYYRDNY